MSARAGLALAAFLGGVSLVGAPLYVSSSASAAAHDQLAHTCRSLSALFLSVPQGVSIDEVAQIGAQVPLVDRPIFVTTSFQVTLHTANSITAPVTLVTRDGDLQQVTPPLLALQLNEIAMPRHVLTALGARVGDHVQADASDGGTVDLVIAQTFDDLPFRPEPDYWCGYADFLRPGPTGDPPPNWGLVATETHDAFPFTARGLEYRPTDDAITMHQARQIEVGYERANAAHDAAYGANGNTSALPELLDHAAGLATGVSRSVAPARLAGVVAAFLTLLAAATFVAKEREQQLRLYAIRGESPWRTALHLVPMMAVPIALGALVGLLTGLISVRALGPTSVVERGVLVDASFVLLVASVAALAIVVAYVAFIGDRLVDAGHSRHWWRNLPIELLAVPLAVVSYRRLADGGALHMSGVDPRGGELLAQAFPLFGLIACAALLYRPLRWLATRLRTAGSRLPRAARLGVRRVVLDPRAAALLVVVFFIAAGCFTTARLLSQTAQQDLTDKAVNFVGADLSVAVFGDVPQGSLTGPTTEVSRISGHLGGDSIEVLGVDRATFADVARMRGDASSQSLDRLLDQITPTGGDALPGILVGGGSLGGTLQIESTVGRPDIVVDVVGKARFFPVSSSGLMVVVDRAALDALAGFGRHAIWFAQPAADAIQQLRADGVKVGPVTSAATVFDTTNYRAQGWSYVPLAALSVLFLLIAVGIQVLIVSARRAGRQQAHVVMQRTGFTTASLWWAALVEVAIPTIVGAAVGTIAGVVLSDAAIGHLDSLPTVAPFPRLVITPWTFLTSGIATLLMIVVVAGIVVRSTLHSDPMKAIRGFDTIS
ncbi:MAG: transporter permease [Ilumatobacteraceae bacterium]|nr:transporter permease [Ilumatobacteraceae bacterium]